MNYMKQVAQMLGVELEEEFKVEGYSDNIKFKLNEMGLEYLSNGRWHSTPYFLSELLNENLKLIKIPKPILDETEKRYLSNVIKPFRNQIESIVKYSYGKYEAINMVNFKVDENMSFIVTNFPYFKKGTMYKGMEIGKRYTLEELGL